MTTSLWTRTSRLAERRRMGLVGLWLGVLGAMVAVNGAALGAQQSSAVAQSAEVDGPMRPLRAPSKGFRLFAEEDFAMTGMKMTGNYGWYASNMGPCPFVQILNNESCANLIMPNGTQFISYFDVSLLAGAGLTDFRKIRQVYPGVNNMLGPLGYTAEWVQLGVTPEFRRWGAADLQFGNLFSGVAAASDGSCRDMSSFANGRVGDGTTLLAGSDCPATWGAAGFGGRHPVPDSVWLARFKANPNGFKFDDWKIGSNELGSELLGSFSTYALTSDFNREALQAAGSVTPRGTGAPTERGFPIGLEIRMDAFQFARPSIRNAMYVQYTIVNRSDKVYGAGIDYDSLYFGLSYGILQAGGNQSTHQYQDVARGALIFAGGNASGKCSATYPRRFTGAGACVNTTAFTRGAHGIVFLKSPIGDLRNKLLADPTSAYYAPASPFRDDTITFNHARRNGFGSLYDNSFLRSDRSLFGYMSSQENVFLDGRAITDFDLLPTRLFNYFYSEDYDGTVSAASARFNRFVPGSPAAGRLTTYGTWDYNNDGVQDTVFVPSCGRRGCAVPYSDTSAGGTVPVAGNQGNLASAGPFKLKANDTTQLIVAFIAAPDSSSFEALLNSTIATYTNNYAGPSPVPPPAFAATDIELTSADSRNNTNADQRGVVRIRVPDITPYNDAFIQGVINRVTGNDPIGVRLRTLNPGLPAILQQRLRNNFSQLQVYKSCDRGQTFTITADCKPARASDISGRDIGFGWRPLATFNVDTTTSRLASNFFTDITQAGRTYLYSFVTRTRGLSDIRVVDSAIVGNQRVLVSTTLAEVLRVDADTVNSPLFRSGPSTAVVYVPITSPAGSTAALLDTATVFGAQTRRVTTVARASSLRSGTFQLFFANRFIVTTNRDTVSGQSTQSVTAQRVLNGGTDPNATVTNFVAGAATFAASGQTEIVVNAAPSTFPTRRGRTGSIVQFVDTLSSPSGSLGYAIVSDSLAATRVYFVNLDITNQTTTTFEASRFFPGFFPTFEALTANSNTPRTNVIIRGSGADTSTIATAITNANGVIYQATPSVLRAIGGQYEITWSGDSYGPNAPFRLSTPAELQASVSASLAARQNASTADTTLATRRALAAAGVDTTTRRLVAARLPFSMTTPNGQPATLAMFRRVYNGTADSLLKNSVLLGNLGDTVRVSVPADLWMPGDSLFVLENTLRDSTVVASGATRTILKDTTIAGRATRIPVRTTARIVAFQPLVLGCLFANSTPNRFSCNPIALTTLGSTGYLPYQPGWRNVVDFARPFELFTTINLTAHAQQMAVNGVTKADLARISVVPNPYVVQSTFDEVDAARTGTARLRFTNVPSSGILRLYTVSGQLVQQTSWTPADLLAAGNGSPNGDLPFTLRTREGLDIGSGLYIWVITTTDANARKQIARGKLVIIR